MNKPLVGLDIGTTSISAVVLDPVTGRNLEVMNKIHKAGLPPDGPGANLQEPEELVKIAEELLCSIRRQFPEIAAIGVTGQMHGIVLVDKDGLALGPAYTWLDNRANWPVTEIGPVAVGAGDGDESGSYREWMQAEIGACEPTGYGVSTLYVLNKLGRIPAGAVAAAGPADYVALRLSTETRPHVAASLAHSMGFFSLEKSEFDSGLWGRISAVEPPIVSSSAAFFSETPDGIPILVPEGDNQMGFLSSVRDPGRAVLFTIGTSGQVSLLEPEEEGKSRSGALERRPFPGKRNLLVGASLSGGKSFELLTNLVAEVAGRLSMTLEAEGSVISRRPAPFELLEGLERPAPEQRLVVDTRFAGTRADPEVRGAIHNIGLENCTLGGLYWGIAAGVVDELAEMLGEYRRILEQSDSYISISGNSLEKSGAVRTILQERFPVPLRRSIDGEAAARGAAMLAGAALTGGIEMLESMQSRMIVYRE